VARANSALVRWETSPVTLCWSPEPGRAIGEGVVECLAQDGATVAINHRVSAADAEQLVAELEKNR
jgi:phosphoheptose isomerase